MLELKVILLLNSAPMIDLCFVFQNLWPSEAIHTETRSRRTLW